MKFSGWIYDKIIALPWTKVFDIDVEHNCRLSNALVDACMKSLVECDLCGHVEHPFRGANDEHYAWRIDQMFELCGASLMGCMNRNSGMLPGKAMKFGKLSAVIENPDDDVSAQVTVIDGSYVYFNMTSYGFWKPVYNFIAKEFNSANLGGNLFKTGRWPAVDSLLKEILR